MRKCQTAIVMAANTVVPIKRRAPAVGEYRMVNRGNGRGEIYVYGIIGMDWFGDGVTAKQFAVDLKALGDVTTIDLRINSDGGVVDDARAMYNLLVEHKATIIAHVDGVAASAASFLAMAGDEIEIADGGFFMIHDVRGGVYGTADDLDRRAKVMRGYNDAVVKTYADRTGASDKQLRAWMTAETWFNAKDAVEHGFADRIVENMKVAAAITDASRFRNLPSSLLPRRAAATSKLAALAAR